MHDAPELDAAAVQRIYLDNLAAVATNYAGAGVQRLVLAGAVRSNGVLDGHAHGHPVPAARRAVDPGAR